MNEPTSSIVEECSSTSYVAVGAGGVVVGVLVGVVVTVFVMLVVMRKKIVNTAKGL